MKIALGQMYVQSACCEDNFNRLKDMVEQAQHEGADLIVFPEMCISGYLLQDKWLDDAFCAHVHSYNERVLALSSNIGIVFGNLYYTPIMGVERGRDGRRSRFNCALFAHNKKWVKKTSGTMDGIYVKQLNPDYRMFDESRYFLSGLELQRRASLEVASPFLFTVGNTTHKIGLEVCEDMWSDDYDADVTSTYIQQGVDTIINVSCSCWTLHKEGAREARIRNHIAPSNGPLTTFVYVNTCGMQNNGKNIVLFDGGSGVFDREGKCVCALNDAFSPEMSIYEEGRANLISPPCDNKLLKALSYAVREVDTQLFSSSVKWIIGLSGGIDSSINAALLVHALGHERVVGYNLATTYNSETTKNNAKSLAHKLNIRLHEGSIESLNSATVETMSAYGYKDSYNSLVYENIQARIRGHLLATFASIEGGVVINNANKVEVALGYCTLYGDCIGAFSPLADLTKVQCFALAQSLNAHFHDDVIATSLLPHVEGTSVTWEMPPSAELKDAQRDPMKWFYHDELVHMLYEYPTGGVEAFMQSYIDGSVYNTRIGGWLKYYKLDVPAAFMNDLEWFLKMQATAVFKRIQTPPIVLVSRGAFGGDYRESQLGFVKTALYDTLKNKILSM